jgi:hypothetical protein
MKLRFLVALVTLAVLAGCSGDTPGEPASASPSPTAQATPGPGAEASAPGTPAGPAPNARSVDTSQFLRPGTTRVAVVYGNMNGVAPEEIVLHSRSNQPGDNGLAAQEYVDAYSWDPGKAEWVQVFDATTFEDSPNGGTNVLETDAGISQALFGPLAMVDFAGDETPELVFGVQGSGATAGPLNVWIFSWLSEGFTTEFNAATERGGTWSLNPDRTLTLDAPEYGPNDPGCCPSGRSIRTIGYDPAAKQIKVLKTVQAQP